MGGISGIYNIDERPVEASQLEHMLSSMAHRGPDGRDIWIDQFVGLGQCLLYTTPESRYERLPRTDNDYTIVADARIDNRNVLIEALNLPREMRDPLTDSELILAAYKQWGPSSVGHLVGDFAFAVWDASEQKLFCARDHFGMKPFHYWQGSSSIIFATDMQAIIRLLPNKPTVNEKRIVDRLIHQYVDKTSTYYEGIYRLPPAHLMEVDNHGRLTVREYWRLDPNKVIQLNGFDDYVQRFRELFVEAVRCRMRSDFDIGTMLSGGLDSSSVACVARDLYRAGTDDRGPLRSLSAITPDAPKSDERKYQETVIASGGFDPIYFRADEVGPLCDLDRRLADLRRPIVGANSFILWKLFERAAGCGVRVILDGFDGDSTVLHGDTIVQEWTLSRNWLAIQQLIGQIAEIYKTTEAQAWNPMFSANVLPTLQALSRSGHPIGALHRLLQLRNHLTYSRRFFLKNVVRVAIPHTASVIQHLFRLKRMSADYSRIFDDHTIERYKLRNFELPLKATDFLHPELHHYHRLVSSHLTDAIEEQESIGAAFQIEVRSPFCDIRLLEFCLATPLEFKMYQGFSRAVLRAAMKGIVPDAVRLRLTKANFERNFFRGLIRYDRGKVQSVQTNLGNIMPFLDRSVISGALNQFLATGSWGQDVYLWHVIAIALWIMHENSVSDV